MICDVNSVYVEAKSQNVAISHRKVVDILWRESSRQAKLKKQEVDFVQGKQDDAQTALTFILDRILEAFKTVINDMILDVTHLCSEFLNINGKLNLKK